MPEIKFTVTPELPRDIAHLAFKKDDIVDLSDASARRWIRRGVAEYVVGVVQEEACSEHERVVVVTNDEPVVEGEAPADDEPSAEDAEPTVDESEDKPRRGRPRK